MQASDRENPCRRLILYEIALPQYVVSKCALADKQKKPRWHACREANVPESFVIFH